MHSVDDVDGGVDMILQSGPTQSVRHTAEWSGLNYRAADLHQSSSVFPPRGIKPGPAETIKAAAPGPAINTQRIGRDRSSLNPRMKVQL